MTRTVGVVVPAYRPDPDRLAGFVDDLHERLAPDVVRVEVDAPAEGIRGALEALPAEVNVATERRGKGAAVTAGFEALETDVRSFADADGATPASSVADVVAPVRDGDADLAVGSRRHPDATVVSHQTVARRLLGDGFAWVGRRLLGTPLYDYQCGAKAVDAETWAAVRRHLYEPGFAWDVELVAVAGALDARIVEVPVRWEDQPGSTVDPVRTTLRLGRGLLVAHHRERTLRKDRLHALLDGRERRGPALVERPAPEAADE
jgi:glycosyltransferase involved in cell wall biosynthesis